MSNNEDIENMNMAEIEIAEAQMESAEESLASISNEIQTLEAFLDNLAATIAGNQGIEAMSRERDEFLARFPPRTLNNNVNNENPPTPPVGVVVPLQRLDNPGSTTTAPPAPSPGNERPVRPPLFAPDLFDWPGSAISSPPETRPGSTRGSGLDEDFRRIIDEMDEEIENGVRGSILADVISDLEARIGANTRNNRDTSSSSTTARTLTGGGGGDAVMTGMGVGSSFDIDSTSVLVRVIKRAALAAAAAGDTTGRAQLEQFQQDLSNTLHRGVNIMQSIMAGLAGNDWLGPLDLESSSGSASEIGDGEAESNDSGLPDIPDLAIRTLLNDYFADADSDESDEGLLRELLDSPRSSHSSRGRAGAGDEENGSLSGGRQQVNRPGSPATVEFFQSIGIRMDKETEANLANGFRDVDIMACPKTYYPEGEPVESEAQEPVISVEPEAEAVTGSGPLPALVSLDDFLGSEDDEEVPVSPNTINGPMESEDTAAETSQDSSLPSTSSSSYPSRPLGPMIELDLESDDDGTDAELEAIIQEYKREKESKKKARESSMVNQGAPQ